MKKIILASQSPRRRQLLKELNIEFDIISPDYDEKLDTDEFSEEIIESIAKNKALSIAEKAADLYPDSLILSADTVVVLENKILGKPKDEDEAFHMLKSLSNKTHKVVTSVSLFDVITKKNITRSTTSLVTFNELDDEDIKKYIYNAKPLDKAGSYGIQELDSHFVRDVVGSFSNIVGLPTETVLQMLNAFYRIEQDTDAENKK